nr:M23 family metallopeptidase [Geobacter sp. DSM 9736]
MLLALPLSAGADLDLPVTTGVVTSRVGWRIDPFGSGRPVYHRGIDIAVPTGTPVRATRGGRVVFAGTHGGHGTTVILEHANGNRTLYGHNSSFNVRLGEHVEAGTVIALSGNSGRSTGPHIHYETMPYGQVATTASIEKRAEREFAAADLRYQQEQRLEETVNSILKKISNSATSNVNGQGG